ncbi:MAG: beta-galactosidase, partial [Tannerella sp.]|nr:beta-galactosidase [Tannerella sp.]
MKKIFFYLLLVAGMYSCRQAAHEIDLSGEWAFAVDPGDIGINEQWYSKSLEGKIRLPGSMQEQGYGEDVGINTKWTGSIVDRSWFDAPEYEPYRQKGNAKIPFWLQPDKEYVG